MNNTNPYLRDPELKEEYKRKRRENQAAYRERQKIKAATASKASSSTLVSAHDLLAVPQVGPSTQVPTRSLDFDSGVRGIQVPESANVITWSGGLQTVAPTLIRDGRNVLGFDEAYVRHVAAYPEAKPGSAYIDFLDKNSYRDQYDLVVAIRRSLSLGHPVVIRDFQDTSSFTFTDDGLLREFGISPNMRVDIHDTERRAAVFHEPHVLGTMSQLIAGISNPNQCHFVLDIPLAQRAMPQSISTLDDGLTVGWSQSQRDMPFHNGMVSSDNLAVRSWGLAHQAGVFTFPHHDADGDATYVLGIFGLKLWTLYFPRDPTLSRDELKDIVYKLCDPDVSDHPEVCAETVYLYPGDLLIQPPAQVHSVYTPTASFTIGGHFYSYDCCHLTEIARYFDVVLRGELTNQVHHHAFETIMQMIIGLPRSDPNRSELPRLLVRHFF
ncbi:hypothetical protein V8E55_003292 [Tylopilus felleus]